MPYTELCRKGTHVLTEDLAFIISKDSRQRTENIQFSLEQIQTEVGNLIS